MPNYKLTEEAWTAREAERVGGILLTQLERNVEYTVDEILTILANNGLSYSNPEYTGIGQKLVQDGIIEAVP